MFSDKSIEIKINKGNIDYYRSIGYHDIKIGCVSMIKSKDVKSTVANRIYVICESCDNEMYIKCQNYHTQIKKNNMYVCKNCSYVKNKITNYDRYGSEHVLQVKEIRDKGKETMILNYGVDNISKVDYIKEERSIFMSNMYDEYHNRMVLKYGVDNISKLPEVKEKKKDTAIRNYGVENPSQDPLIFEKSQKSGKKIKLHEVLDIYYRGSYEKDFLDFCVSVGLKVEKGPTLKYVYDGKTKTYHSDFLLIDYNLICEIKSSYYMELFYEKNMCKKTCSEKDFNFIFIVDKKYDLLLEYIKKKS